MRDKGENIDEVFEWLVHTNLKERIREKHSEWRITLEKGTRLVLKDRKVNYEVLTQINLVALNGFII